MHRDAGSRNLSGEFSYGEILPVRFPLLCDASSVKRRVVSYTSVREAPRDGDPNGDGAARSPRYGSQARLGEPPHAQKLQRPESGTPCAQGPQGGVCEPGWLVLSGAFVASSTYGSNLIRSAHSCALAPAARASIGAITSRRFPTLACSLCECPSPSPLAISNRSEERPRNAVLGPCGR